MVYILEKDGQPLMLSIGKNMNTLKLHPEYIKAIEYTKKTLYSSEIGNDIKYIILYGSSAREDIKFHSDIDILVVFDDLFFKKRENVHIYRKIRNSFFDVEDIPEIDIKAVSLSSWLYDKTIYLDMVRKEGIAL